MIYTPVEKNFRGVQPPDVLLGAWHWKVEEGKIVDFNANISKISTIGEASQPPMYVYPTHGYNPYLIFFGIYMAYTHNY
jgi:hypothetical protein